MADFDPTMTLERTAPTALAPKRPDLSLEVERNLGIAKLRFFYHADADVRFRQLVGVAAPNAGWQAEHKSLTFAWLAPGEWLVTGPEDVIADWLGETEERGGDEALVLDFSHARVSFLLGGAKARATLAAHCPLDLWPGVFPVGAVARTLLGDTAMFIARLADAAGNPCFRIITDQTMAAYVGRLLADT